MPKPTLQCGLCHVGPHETDQLVKLGTMGYICLGCLDQVAAAALPWAALNLSRPAPAPRENNVLPFRPRRPAQRASYSSPEGR